MSIGTGTLWKRVLIVIPIVLTGTIIPNAISVTHADWEIRRNEYLQAIKYYQQYSKVFFLENSQYELLHDFEFSSCDGLKCVKYTASTCYDRGKGYQEFKMLDDYVTYKLEDDYFIKVSGRYIYKNFSNLYAYANENRNKYGLIIDAHKKSKTATTSLFFAKKSVYLAAIKDLYLQMNDSEGGYAEHVIFRKLQSIASYTFFPEVPVLNVISGSTGGNIITNTNVVKMNLKNAQRKILRVLNVKHPFR